MAVQWRIAATAPARLQDETGADFVVFNLPWKLLATPDMAAATMIAFKNFDFDFAFAIRRAGRWIYVAKESLKAVCESQLGQRPNWQEISASPSSPI